VIQQAWHFIETDHVQVIYCSQLIAKLLDPKARQLGSSSVDQLILSLLRK
jgi:hypothetical protein